MHSPLPIAISLAVFSCAPGAQSKPCAAMNDKNTSVSNAITLFAFAGPNQFAYQFTPSTSLIAQGLRIFTGNKFRDGFMTLAVWSHDATNNSPKSRLAGGTWKNPKPTAPGWFGTNFDGIVVMQAKKPYWFVWTEPGFSTPPLQPGSLNKLPSVFRSGSGAWRSVAAQALKFRLYCSQIDEKNVTVFGSPCPGASGSRGTAFTNTPPSVGNANFRLEGTGLPSGANAFLALGVNKAFKSIPLGPLATGCSLHTETLLVVTGKTGTGNVRSTTGAAGHVSFALPIPKDPAVKGAFISSQIAVVDAKSKNTLPLVFTNGLRIVGF